MDETKQKLAECFNIVFPSVKEPERLTQETAADWDSVAAITLINVIEEQFNIQLEYDEVAPLDSFEKILDYLKASQKVH